MNAEERTVDPDAQGAERRTRTRFDVDEDSQLLLVNHGLLVESRILDLSLDGCRMYTTDRFTAGLHARVELSFKINGIDFRFCGLTQWTDGQHQVGIRFVDVSARRRGDLAEVISEVEAAITAKAEELAAEKLAVEQQAHLETEEAQVALNKAQALLELAEKQARDEALQALALFEEAELQLRETEGLHLVPARLTPAPVPAPIYPDRLTPKDESPEPPGQPAPRPAPRDRRAQSRHEVDTSAVIHLINVGSKVGGRINDLSVSGCRIHTENAFPVGIYTRVETEFNLEGLPFRLGGVVQAIHDRDRHSVGIRFLDMSDRKREQVEQLIDEIEQMRASRKLPDSGK